MVAEFGVSPKCGHRHNGPQHPIREVCVVEPEISTNLGRYVEPETSTKLERHKDFTPLSSGLLPRDEETATKVDIIVAVVSSDGLLGYMVVDIGCLRNVTNEFSAANSPVQLRPPNSMYCIADEKDLAFDFRTGQCQITTMHLGVYQPKAFARAENGHYVSSVMDYRGSVLMKDRIDPKPIFQGTEVEVFPLGLRQSRHDRAMTDQAVTTISCTSISCPCAPCVSPK